MKAIKNKPSRHTLFKIWCIKNNVSQVKIAEDTKLSVGCVHTMWNDGKATASTIKLLSLVYGIEEKKLKHMINTFVKNDPDLKKQAAA